MASPAGPGKYMSKLHNASILILGGTSGIGYAVAEACLEFRCARLTIAGSRQAKVDAVIARLRASYPSSTHPTHLSGLACDLGDAAMQERNLTGLLDFATAADDGSGGRKKLNHIVNTAGDSFSLQPLSQITPDTLHKSSIVRFYGSIMLAKLLASTPERPNPYIEVAPSSSVTFTGGSTATKPLPGWSAIVPFAAAKEGMTRALAIDLKPIRVNCVALGAVHTELLTTMSQSNLPENSPPEAAEKRLAAMLSLFKSKTLTNTVAQPEDAAEAYLWLMRDRFVTGTCVHSDGGYLLV